ncbi:MAG: M16 family metallopeptidase, partial [Aggregatilineales bacterium]
MSNRFPFPDENSITRLEFENGMVLLIYPNPTVKSVTLFGALRAGSLYENPVRNGLASLTAAALMRGTRTRDFDALYGTLEDIGADLGFSAGRHSISFAGRALAEDLPVLIDVLEDVLRRPSFPVDPVDKLRTRRLTELNYSQYDTRYRATRAFREALYPDHHPYHYSTYGSPMTLPNLVTDNLRDFHRKHYGPDGMVTVIVGAVKPDDVIEMVGGKLADWSNLNQPDAPILPAIHSPDKTERLYTGIPGKSQTSIVMGTLGPSRLNQDYNAAIVANSILGEFGLMGRIGDVVREQLGLAYYAYSRIEGGSGPGTWAIEAGVAPDDVELTLEKICDEIRRIVSEPVSDDDLADNQSYFTGRLPLRLEDSDGIAATLMALERYGLGLNYIHNYHETIYALTKSDLQS